MKDRPTKKYVILGNENKESQHFWLMQWCVPSQHTFTFTWASMSLIASARIHVSTPTDETDWASFISWDTKGGFAGTKIARASWPWCAIIKVIPGSFTSHKKTNDNLALTSGSTINDKQWQTFFTCFYEIRSDASSLKENIFTRTCMRDLRCKWCETGEMYFRFFVSFQGSSSCRKTFDFFTKVDLPKVG